MPGPVVVRSGILVQNEHSVEPRLPRWMSVEGSIQDAVSFRRKSRRPERLNDENSSMVLSVLHTLSV